MKYKLVLSTLLITTSLLSGCAGSASSRVTCGAIQKCQIEIKAEGTWGLNVLKPITTMIASLTGFTYSDWVGLDISEYYLAYEETSSITNIENRLVTVNVYDGVELLSTKDFATKKVGANVYFKVPSEVKSWSEQFIDIGTEVTIDFKQESYVAAPGTTTVSLKQNNLTLDSIDVSHYICGGGNVPVHMCNDNW